MSKKKHKTTQKEKKDTVSPHTVKNTAERLNEKVKKAHERLDIIHNKKDKKETRPEYKGPLYTIRLPKGPQYP